MAQGEKHVAAALESGNICVWRVRDTTEAGGSGVAKRTTANTEVSCTIATLGFAPESQVLDCRFLETGRLLVAHGSLVKPTFEQVVSVLDLSLWRDSSDLGKRFLCSRMIVWCVTLLSGEEFISRGVGVVHGGGGGRNT